MPKLQKFFLFKILILICTLTIVGSSFAGEVFYNLVQFDFDGREWVADYANANKDLQIVEYVLKGETVENWSELVTIQTYPFKPEDDILDLLQKNYFERLKKSNPNLIHKEIFRESDKIIDEFVIEDDGKGGRAEYSLSLYIIGEEGVHMVLYASHSKKSFEDYKQKWINAFQTATVSNPSETNKNLNNPLLSNPDKMIYIEYRHASIDIPLNSFASNSKKLWRSTNTFFRSEEQVDLENDLQVFIIVHEPDMWMYNKVNNRGRHDVDPGPTFNTRLPAFGEMKDNGLMNFEFGQEQAFFKHYGARQLKDEIVDTHDCNVFELTRLYWVLKMYVRKDTNLPYLVTRKGPDKSTMSIYYEKYEVDINFDSIQFQKPEGISWQ